MQDVTLIPSTALQSQGIAWRIATGQVLEMWSPQIVYVDDDVIAVTGLDTEAEIVTSRISGATDGMQITTVEN